MASLLETAASNAVVATVLALVVFPVARGLRRPALAHGLWIVVLAKFLTPSLIAICDRERRVGHRRGTPCTRYGVASVAFSPDGTVKVWNPGGVN
jgi:hypothetical protein